MTVIPHNRPNIAAASIEAATAALRDGVVSAGRAPAESLAVLRRFLAADHVHTTSSGTSALQAALVGVGVGAGSTVVVPTVTCPAVFHAVRAVGGQVRLIDVGPTRPVIEAASVQPGEFVIAPSMFGCAVDIPALASTDAVVIHDAAQSLRPVASGAQATVLSFSPTKLLTAGYGGAVATADERVADRVARFLSPDDDCGADADLDPPLPFRVNAALDGFRHVLLAREVERYDEIVAARRRIRATYISSLPDLPVIDVEVPMRHLVEMQSGTDADDVALALVAEGVEARPLPSHLLHRTFRIDGSFPNADAFRARVISLPLHETMSDDEVQRVVSVLRTVLG